MRDKGRDPTGTFDELFECAELAAAMQALCPAEHAAVNAFWESVCRNGPLSPRMRELVLLAMHVSATALNAEVVKRQVKRVLSAGGTREDIVDVVVTIASVANHALYSSVPILEEELAAAGHPTGDGHAADPALEAAKQRFIAIRGVWNADRDPLMRQMPEYCAALMDLSSVSWQNGPLTTKERELVAIGIDCTVTHSYPPGLRLHIRNAICAGATRDEILQVFQLAATFGLEGYLVVGEAMFGRGLENPA
jgi:alkylhydroperoxidase/carboxymuconolactone decarboxylase family protein YurZ